MTWPHGGGVDLVVTPDKPYYLQPNDVPSFKSVIVQSGASFVIGTDFFSSNPWAVIGCFGDFILHGSILVRGSPIYVSQDYPLNAPDGIQRSVTFHQGNGGNGGGAYATSAAPGGIGGVTAFGNGGGGAAPFGRGADGGPNGGGGGGTASFPYPSDHWSKGPGGAGGTVAVSQDNKAGSGQRGGDGNNGDGTTGGGGGGGARGLHGGFLYLRVLGSFIASDGYIDLSGSDGGDGGGGGDSNRASWQGTSASGAGGGGGAGGNGGFVLIRYGRDVAQSTDNREGGRAGNGGPAGTARPNSSNAHAGASGSPGQTGYQGNVQYEKAT